MYVCISSLECSHACTQLLYNVFYPLVKGIRILLLKYIDWFPLPVTLMTSRLAHLIFGVASAEETAMIIVLSFTLCAYASVLLLGYSLKLAAFIAARLVAVVASPDVAARFVPASLYDTSPHHANAHPQHRDAPTHSYIQTLRIYTFIGTCL